jgi:beta-glucuronidase
MRFAKIQYLIVVGILLQTTLTALGADRVDLDGSGWTFRTTQDPTPVDVTVPHCWPVVDKYRNYIGDAIYEHDFSPPPIHQGRVVRIHFDAVYDVATVWLNGLRLGTHTGGYTPFEFDVTKLLKIGQNHLVVEVNNMPTISSIPSIATSHSAKNYPVYGSVGKGTVVGWMPYGGIVRPVSLIITDAIFIRDMKVDATPNLQTGTATIKIRAKLHNGGDMSVATDIRGSAAGLSVDLPKTLLAAGEDADIVWTGKLANARLWSLRDPYLYDVLLQIPGDSISAKIGVREVRVRGTELLLNGNPVHLFGANRVSEDPVEGLRESDAIVNRDMSDMLAANMRMMRIAHYPQTPALLDFADTHGMLLIAEAGNWNMSAWQMADPEIRGLWKTEMKEMMEQDWNHPSVIAWSVGNEYESFTKDGIDWTRDMRVFTSAIDPTRLITFASRFTQEPVVKIGKDEASQYSDFVSVNVYGDYAKRFDRVHELYPDKPVFVTEFGKMGEPGKHDFKRIEDITTAVDVMKARPWMIGGSLWTWSDYRSLFPGTPENGVRNWGVVEFNREHRDSWEVVRKLFATELP